MCAKREIFKSSRSFLIMAGAVNVSYPKQLKEVYCGNLLNLGKSNSY